MEFNNELLCFDRVSKCDWCGTKKLVGITHYGTSNYNRIICEECAKKHIAHDEVYLGKGCHNIQQPKNK